MIEPLTPAEIDDIEETSVPPEEGVGQRSWVTIGEARAMIATIRDLQRLNDNLSAEAQRSINELGTQMVRLRQTAAEQAQVIGAARNYFILGANGLVGGSQADLERALRNFDAWESRQSALSERPQP